MAEFNERSTTTEIVAELRMRDGTDLYRVAADRLEEMQAELDHLHADAH